MRELGWGEGVRDGDVKAGMGMDEGMGIRGGDEAWGLEPG
jgi:hypothetical protein